MLQRQRIRPRRTFLSTPTRTRRRKDKDGDDQGGKDKGDKPEKAGKDRIEVKGRVFVLAEHRDDKLAFTAGEFGSKVFSLSLPTARAGLKARVLDNVTLVIEADFGGKVTIKDGYIQAKGKRWMVRAGRFKMPMSAFVLESPWTLPRAQRGILDDLLQDHLLIFGRREGVMGRLEGGGWWDPALSVGAFQSLLYGANAGDAMAMASPKDMTGVVRVSITPAGTEVALVAQRRVTLLGAATRAFASAGADATSEITFAHHALRLWGEAMLGQSWYQTIGALNDVDPVKQGEAPAVNYAELRAMAAFRRGGLEKGDGYGELFFSGGVLDPDLDVTQDHFLEISAGLNVGQWQRTRLTLEIEHARAARNFPRSIFLAAGKPAVIRHTAALLQVGAAF